MAVKTLFGWGGVMIHTTEFATAFGTVSFDPVYIRNTTIAGKHIQHFKGWRVVIECELFNDGSDTQAAAFVALSSVISGLTAANTPVTVYPRYTASDAGCLTWYSCFLDSSFSPTDWANTQVGQSIKLKFISEELVNNLPTNTSNPSLSIRVTDSADHTALRVTDSADHDKIRAENGGS
jgi:hypothetical protein